MKEKISWKIVAIILVPILLVLALCGIAVSCEEEDENKIPNMWAHPERWWVEFGEGYAVKDYSTHEEIPLKDLTQCEITYPQGAMNLADIQKEKRDLVITYSGYYGDYRTGNNNLEYYPGLRAYYYDKENNQAEPYFIGVKESSIYFGDCVNFEDVKQDDKKGAWMYCSLDRPGIYKITYYPYHQKSAWYYATTGFGFDVVLTAYVIIENKQLVEV